MNKVNYLALGAVACTIIAVFSPWVEVNVASGTSDLSENFQPVIIHGISMGYGIFGMLIALLGGFLVYRENKWTVVAGIVNFITGYGYLHEWFGKGTRDSANYGDVTSQSSVDPKFGIYLFIFASLAFIVFTAKYYRQKRAVTVAPPLPSAEEHPQPLFTVKKPVAPQTYQPSKIQTMTTFSSETPNEPASSEKPKVPETTPDTPVTPAATEPVEPTVTAKPAATHVPPVQAVVPEPAPVYQAPVAPAAPAAPHHHYAEPEKKKSSISKILLIVLALVIVASAALVLTTNNSQKSTDKTEQSINEEKARLEEIIHEVKQAVSDGKYDDALLQINSINWLYDPTANKGYVDQYNSQRENLRKTIVELKVNQDAEKQKQATDKAIESAMKPVQPTDTVK